MFTILSIPPAGGVGPADGSVDLLRSDSQLLVGSWLISHVQPFL